MRSKPKQALIKFLGSDTQRRLRFTYEREVAEPGLYKNNPGKTCLGSGSEGEAWFPKPSRGMEKQIAARW